MKTTQSISATHKLSSQKPLGTPKELKCVSCHYDAGHGAGFRNYLEYWKPSYKIYDKKMIEKRIETKQKFFKDEYKPTKDEEEFLKQKAEKDAKKPAGGGLAG